MNLAFGIEAFLRGFVASCENDLISYFFIITALFLVVKITLAVLR